ncbi:hypothetical protein H6501_03815 [Candidatus Woesearchaeota archaeon]|nr:hypothetical protein [Candidatus Woesearchaeota archaeon]
MEEKKINLKTLLFSLLLFFVLVIVLFAVYSFFVAPSFVSLDESNPEIILPVGHLACESDECKFDWARENQNVSLCFDIVDETLRASCSASITRFKIIEESVLSDNISACDSFEDESSHQYCRDNYYFVGSVNKGDKSLCSFIVSEEMRNECEK